MSRLIETIRISDGKPQNLEYHSRRMRNLYSENIQGIEFPSQGVHKLRIVYDQDHFTYTITPYTIRPVRSLKLVFDNNIVYDQKFEDRSAIDTLLTLKEDCDDILIIKNGLVTDVSYANIIFKRDNEWYTPDSFLLNGTMRQNLLDTRRIKEYRINVDNLKDFTHFRLINAMLRDEAPESEILNIR